MKNFLEVLKLIKFKIFNGMFFRRENKISLYKNNDYNNIKMKFSSCFIKAKESNHIETLTEKIKNFIIIMKRDCKNFNENILLENFKKTLFDISEVTDNEKDSCSGCVYASTLDNTKVLNATFMINNFCVTNHELIHLSTLLKSSCGFSIIRDQKSIAEGLNEGYTQLLAKRYFNECVNKAYPIETFFSSILEKIIGKDKMETYFFKASLLSLIDEMEKYENNENIMKFIHNMDYFIENSLNSKESINNMQKIINEICKFLLSCTKSKINIILSEEPYIDYDDYINLLSFEMFSASAYFHTKISGVIEEYIINLFDINEVAKLEEYAKFKYEIIQNANKNKKR